VFKSSLDQQVEGNGNEWISGHPKCRIFDSFPGGSFWAPGCPAEASSFPLKSLSYLTVPWRRSFGAKGVGMHVPMHWQVDSSNEPSVSLAGRGELRSSSGSMGWGERFVHLHLETGFLCSQQCPFSAQGNIWGQSTSTCKRSQHRAAEIRPSRQTGCPHSALRDRPFVPQDPQELTWKEQGMPSLLP